MKNAQTTYQAQQLQIQQQQFHANEESSDDHKLSRNSLEASRLSGEYGSIKDLDGNSDQHNKKGMAGLFSQMRTIASSGGSYLSSVDQNKQISKFAKMKKDIAEADSEYRDGILILEALRKKQRKAVEETNWVTTKCCINNLSSLYLCGHIASKKHYKKKNRRHQVFVTGYHYG